MSTTGPAEGSDSEQQTEHDPSSRAVDSGAPSASASPPQPAAKARGTAGGYAWVDPWTGMPTARYQPPPGEDGYPAVYSGQSAPLAVAALLCGLFQFLAGLVVFYGNILLAIPAVICGSIALRRINARIEAGRGMAIAGLVLGILGIIYFMLVVIAIAFHGAGSSGGTT